VHYLAADFCFRSVSHDLRKSADNSKNDEELDDVISTKHEEKTAVGLSNGQANCPLGGGT
jgi:hypothetical protein